MSKVAIVYWSSTGNTETMANCIAEGAGASATVLACADVTPDVLAAWGPLEDEPHLLGNSHSTGQWALFGVTAAELASLWPSWRNQPVPGLA